MERRLVQAGGSLAVTLPAEIVKEFKLKKGMSVEVSIHPQTRAVTIRPGVRRFEDGKVTKRFGSLKGLRDRGALLAAIGRPQMTFGGEDLYPEVPDKVAALMHSLVMNHPSWTGTSLLELTRPSPF